MEALLSICNIYEWCPRLNSNSILKIFYFISYLFRLLSSYAAGNQCSYAVMLAPIVNRFGLLHTPLNDRSLSQIIRSRAPSIFASEIGISKLTLHTGIPASVDNVLISVSTFSNHDSSPSRFLAIVSWCHREFSPSRIAP